MTTVSEIHGIEHGDTYKNMCIVTESTRICTAEEFNAKYSQKITLRPAQPSITDIVELIFDNDVARLADFKIYYEDASVCTAGEWIEVYSQNKPTTEFETCNYEGCNIFIDSSNFINFDKVTNLPSYRMKYQWDENHFLEWTQEINPLYEGKVSNLKG